MTFKNTILLAVSVIIKFYKEVALIIVQKVLKNMEVFWRRLILLMHRVV